MKHQKKTTECEYYCCKDTCATDQVNEQTDYKHKKPSKRKRSLLTRLIGVGVKTTAVTGMAGIVGTWGAWRYAKQQAKIRRDYTPAYNRLVTTERYEGVVQRIDNELVFVTASATYALQDPLAKLESIYHTNDKHKQKNPKLIDKVHRDEICILAELSQKGQYGYLGHLDYQLTVKDICQ